MVVVEVIGKRLGVRCWKHIYSEATSLSFAIDFTGTRAYGAQQWMAWVLSLKTERLYTHQNLSRQKTIH